ncbi:MAG: MlaE family lipid ABC transporter permease subunit [Pseudomonadota bacterium]|nr:MlaE family lipid ABC transporter permease subunit [Pseudomonadota bacterium]
MLNYIEAVGQATSNALIGAGKGFNLFITILFNIPLRLRYWYFIIEQIYFVGVLSLLVIVVSGAFMGMVLALQGEYTLSSFGAKSELSSLIALSVFREIGPVISALLFAGRAGSAITAEVGSMRVSDQITSMEVMSVDPVSYILFPRLVAGIISMPMLTIIFSGVAIYSGYLVSTSWLGIDSGTFISVMRETVDFHRDVMQGIYKSFAFGVVVMIIALKQGFFTKSSSTGIGLAATKTVVYSSLSILALDFVITSLLLGGMK